MKKFIVDITMTLSFVLMMGYHMFDANIHEYLGLILLAICIVHQLLNIKWYQYLNKGKYSYIRSIYLILNILLIISFITMMMSGLLISKNFLLFGVYGGGLARKLHLMTSAWVYVLTAIHIGLHGKKIKGIILKVCAKESIYFKELKYISFVLGLYGLIAFYKRGFINDMFLLVEYKFLPFQEPFLGFITDYVSILITFIYIGYCLTLVKLTSNKHKKDLSL